MWSFQNKKYSVMYPTTRKIFSLCILLCGRWLCGVSHNKEDFFTLYPALWKIILWCIAQKWNKEGVYYNDIILRSITHHAQTDLPHFVPGKIIPQYNMEDCPPPPRSAYVWGGRGLHGPCHMLRPGRHLYERGLGTRGPSPLTHTNL